MTEIVDINKNEQIECETEKSLSLGCDHYRRKCQFKTPCCEKFYTCRFCHDEKEQHKLNRKDVSEIKCLQCCTIQNVQQTCKNCGACFGRYFCGICKLFDDEDKRQYHCDECGICRVGGRDKFFHCEKCDMCLPIRVQNGHKCVEKVSRSNCPVCLEDLHTSRIPSHIPPCGHLVHRNCFEELLKTGNYACPICMSSMVDMKEVWQLIDREIQLNPMPSDYENYYLGILCRDCHKESIVKLHILALKCTHCGSYNTCRIKEVFPASNFPGPANNNSESSSEASTSDSSDSATSDSSDSGTSDGSEAGTSDSSECNCEVEPSESASEAATIFVNDNPCP